MKQSFLSSPPFPNRFSSPREKTLRLHGSDRLALLQAALNEALAAPGAADASPAPQQPSSNRHEPGKAVPDSRAFASERKRQTYVQEYHLPHLSV